jgi:hypothetical protein
MKLMSLDVKFDFILIIGGLTHFLLCFGDYMRLICLIKSEKLTDLNMALISVSV